MSWAEVFKINKNMKRSLDEQLRDMKHNPIRVITTTGTYTPEKTGLYKVICIGAGGDSYYRYSGGERVAAGHGGGVAIKDLFLDSDTSYNVTVSTSASFGTELTATAGSSDYYLNSDWYNGEVGTASGGDYNFNGTRGDWGTASNVTRDGGSVGVVIGEFTRQRVLVESFGGNTLMYGESLLNYGGGGPAVFVSNSDGEREVLLNGLPAAILIIPLEMEE